MEKEYQGEAPEFPPGIELNEEERKLYEDSDLCLKTSQRIMREFLRAHGHISQDAHVLRDEMWSKLVVRTGIDFLSHRYVVFHFPGMKTPVAVKDSEYREWAKARKAIVPELV